MRGNVIAGGIAIAALIIAGCSPSGAATDAPSLAATAPPSVAATDAPSLAATQPPSEAPSACEKSADTAAVEVTIIDFAFDPSPVTAAVGQPIGWTNQDRAPHTATLDVGACGTGNIAAGGGTGMLVFSVPGEYPYHCAVHPQMTGSIVITN